MQEQRGYTGVRQYRGKRLDNGEWVYGSLISDRFIVGDVLEWNDEYFNTEWWLAVDPDTVGQYIGRNDEHGKEIYEGAELLVTIKDWNTGKVLVKDRVKVEFRDCQFGFEWGNRREFTTFSGFANTTFELLEVPHE